LELHRPKILGKGGRLGDSRICTECLGDLIEGIKEAQSKEGVGGYVAPDAIGSHTFPAGSGVSNSARLTSTVVKFDMAVTAETSQATSGEGKAKIVVLEADMGGRMEARNAHASRIQFSVPVLMPRNVRDSAGEDEQIGGGGR
jgi:hypothetical protein